MPDVPESEAPRKGHWRKGRSRNLDPTRVAQGRVLADLLRRAITQGWRHPALGPLSTRVVGAAFDVDHSTVAKWCRGDNLPLWALDRLRELLREYQP